MHKTLDSLPNAATEERVWRCISVVECLPVIHKTLSSISSNRKSPKSNNKGDCNLLQTTVSSVYFFQFCYWRWGLRGKKKHRIEAKPKEMATASISELYLICQLHDIHVQIPICVFVHVYISDSGKCLKRLEILFPGIF